jgi:hypothetical protein
MSKGNAAMATVMVPQSPGQPWSLYASTVMVFGSVGVSWNPEHQSERFIEVDDVIPRRILKRSCHFCSAAPHIFDLKHSTAAQMRC